IAAAIAVAAAAGLVWAMAGDPQPVAAPRPTQPVVTPLAPEPAPPAKPSPKPAPPAPPVTSEPPEPTPPPPPKPTPSPTPKPTPKPTPPPSPKPTPRPTPKPTPKPTPTPGKPAPKPTAPPPAPPSVYQVSELDYGIFGDGTKPEVSLSDSSWMWQRGSLSMDGTPYAHGVSVHAPSSLLVDLNRQCTSYDAVVGVDDLSALPGVGGVRFSVYGDGERLWRSDVVRAGDPPVPVHVDISGRSTIRLVVEEHTPFGRAAVADWAESRISCS
ncbi:NPCBM/NEW2 domain-containing protein, partial [Streptomyces tanashiensis]|uniref:NPCBM/NEW2 domain-containing protein n=1 Tax=Streptomyces tanashiensis TaxID=67367 RepID=UPI0033E5E068